MRGRPFRWRPFGDQILHFHDNGVFLLSPPPRTARSIVMAYRFQKKDPNVQAAVRRIARQQVEGALEAIDKLDGDKATHEVRKACKKLRALLGLVRPVFANYARENAALRDLARTLSGARDARVLLDTFDVLVHDLPEAKVKPLAAVRARLAGGQQAITGKPLDEARAGLEAARERIAGWELEEHGWKALGPGLRMILRRARKAARRAEAAPTAESYHELRKLMKHHWYHARLLAPLWPATLGPRVSELGRLADLLGLHHDIAVFVHRITEDAGDPDIREAANVLLDLARLRTARLEREIGPRAARLLAEKPSALADHWRALWRIWHARREAARA